MKEGGGGHRVGPLFLVVALLLMLLGEHIIPYTEFADTNVADGFQVERVADDLGGPACLEWVNHTALLVCDRDGGTIRKLQFNYSTAGLEWKRTGGDSVWLDGFYQPHDILIQNDFVLVSDRGRLTRINHSGLDSDWMNAVKNSERWVLIDGVPTGNHQTNNLDIMLNETVIWHVGSTCNICVEEDERNAALLWVNPENGEHGVLASGVRNSFHGTWVPDMGYLFSDNGRDWEGDHPPEEVNLLIAGEDYGWPEDGPETPIPEGTIGPVAIWTPHSSLNNLAFRPTDSPFPGGSHTVYATVFGSWNTLVPVGHEIVRIDFSENDTTPQGWQAETTVFASQISSPLPLAFHPSGDYLFYATFSGDGSLFAIYPDNHIG